MKIRYKLLVLSLILVSCKGLKDIAVEENEQNIEEEIVEGVGDMIVSPDDSPNLCTDDWNKRPRKITYKNTRRINELNNSSNGEIYIVTKVNRAGEVIDVKLDKKNTTITDKIAIQFALDIVLEFEFEADQDGLREECGTVIFNLNNM